MEEEKSQELQERAAEQLEDVEEDELPQSVLEEADSAASMQLLLDSREEKGVVFSDALSEAISEILVGKSDDPLDEQNFNPIDYINQLFPTEQSLVDMDQWLMRMRVKIRQLDNEVAGNVRQLSTAGDKARSDLGTAHAAIEELFGKINDIKEKAEQSEVMVQEICRDIKSLDHAKKNITTSITGLKRVHMLVTGVAQLGEWTNKRQYREVGNLLEAVNQLATHFRTYANVSKIISLTEQVNAIKVKLRAQVKDEFRSLDKPGNALSPMQLSDVCFVIDALGTETKEEFQKWFCTNRMTDYRQAFTLSDEAARLEVAERRYLWAKREMRYYEKHYAQVFPASWRMQEKICLEFAALTRENMNDILSRKNTDVKVLLHALKETLKWEGEMCEFFAAQPVFDYEDGGGEPTAEEEEEEEEEDPNENPHSAAAIAKRYKRFQKKKEKERARAEHRTSAPVRQVQKFKDVVSVCFGPHLDGYIDEEETLMGEKFRQIIQEETWEVEDGAKNKVLRSSTDLMYYFKTAMRRVTKLTRAEPFFKIYAIFKKFFSHYAKALTAKIPDQQQEPPLELSAQEERTLCLVVNTAEYCSELCQQLAKTVKELIAKPYVPEINMRAEQQEFSGVVAEALKTLVAGMKNKVTSALVAMTRLPWGSWEEVGDQNDYVNQISTHVSQSVPLYNDWLKSDHARFFWESFVGAFIPLLVHHIYRCRQISTVGAEQLLLDITATKQIFLDMPTLTNTRNTPSVPSAFTKYVTKEMAKSEKIPKVIQSPQGSMVSTFITLVPKGTESLLCKLMDLKGIPKGEQQQLISQYRTAKGVKQAAAAEKQQQQQQQQQH